MNKAQYDVLIYIPLPEEFHIVSQYLSSLEAVGNNDDMWFAASYANVPDLSILLVHGKDMGREAAATAVQKALMSYDIGLVICYGIAGTLHATDLPLGSVCVSQLIIDVLENAKVTGGTRGGRSKMKLSPVHYQPDSTILARFKEILLLSKTGQSPYSDWKKWQDDKARPEIDRLPGVTSDKLNVATTYRTALTNTNALIGTIACGMVSGSTEYNKQVLECDRRIKAIETESGPIFRVCQEFKTPVITIRGISDPADHDKTILEECTGGLNRKIAADNAATFMFMALRTDRVNNFFRSRKMMLSVGDVNIVIDNKEEQLLRLSEHIASELSSLFSRNGISVSPARLPVPRLYDRDGTIFDDDGSDYTSPFAEVRDVLRLHRRIKISVPRNYQDEGLPWILANDLLSSGNVGKIFVPIVVDFELLNGKHKTFQREAPIDIDQFIDDSNYAVVFIIDNISNSRTNGDVLLSEFNKYKDRSTFVFLKRRAVSLIDDEGFCSKYEAHDFGLRSISFQEITSFVQCQLGGAWSDAEVIAYRLNRMLRRFGMEAHTTFISALGADMLQKLVKINKRAELLGLGVHGILLSIRAGDKSQVQLSWSTREKFLKRVAVQSEVEKKSFSYSDLLCFTAAFARENDFDIDSKSFLDGFIDEGVMEFVDDRLSFPMPFVMNYCLAKALSEEPSLASSYFDFSSDIGMANAFDIYAELGASPELVGSLLNRLYSALTSLAVFCGNDFAILSSNYTTPILKSSGRRFAIQRSLAAARKRAASNESLAGEKQRLIDLSERVRRKRKESNDDLEKKFEETPLYIALNNALSIWSYGLILLSHGSESLQAEVKRALATAVIQMAECIIEGWCRLNSEMDIVKLMRDDIEASFKPDDKRDSQRIVDILEHAIKCTPVRQVLGSLCEEAHNVVLEKSVRATETNRPLFDIVRACWLADLSVKTGKVDFRQALRNISLAPVLRYSLCEHFLGRAYWSKSQYDEKVGMIELADMVLGDLKMPGLNKEEQQRRIDNSMDETSRNKKRRARRRVNSGRHRRGQ